MKKAMMYFHGKGGTHLEAKQYQSVCKGFDVVGIRYDIRCPWKTMQNISDIYNEIYKKYSKVWVLANSIGAYFAMLALQSCPIQRALLISPVVNMEQLILDMMKWADVSETELEKQGEIATVFGETLSWEYLCFVRSHPILWKIPTAILYAEKDELISKESIDRFVKQHRAELCVMKGGEHWFHTEEQLKFLYAWIEQTVNNSSESVQEKSN